MEQVKQIKKKQFPEEMKGIYPNFNNPVKSNKVET